VGVPDLEALERRHERQSDSDAVQIGERFGDCAQDAVARERAVRRSVSGETIKTRFLEIETVGECAT